MPKIQMTAQGGSITYDADDWFGSQDTTSAGADDRKIGNGAALWDQVDPLRKPGYISPSFLPVAVTNESSVTSYLRNAAVNADSAILISGGNTVQKLSGMTTGTISTTAPFPHTINDGHTNIIGDDIVNYYEKTALKAFFSYRDDTDWNIGVYDYTGDTFDDDFMSTVPDTVGSTSPLQTPYTTGGKSAPHPLIVGDDDVLYIGDRNYVHAYDGQAGTNGIFYPAVLTLPVGWVITSFAKKTDVKLMIGAYYSPSGVSSNTFYLGQAKVWQWNYLDLDPDYAYDLHDNVVSEIFNWRGTIAAFTSGRKTGTEAGTFKLQALNGSEFEVVKSYDTGSLPIRGGVTTVENDIYWNGAGRVFFYAKNPYKNEYMFGNLFGNGNTTSGILKLFTSTFIIHFSDGSGASSGLRYMAGSYNTAGNFYGKSAVPQFPALKRGRLKEIVATFAAAIPSGDTRSFSLNTQLDISGGGVVISTLTNFTNLKMKVDNNNVSGTPLGDFSKLQPQLLWGSGVGANAKTQCPVVDNIVFHFEFTNINN